MADLASPTNDLQRTAMEMSPTTDHVQSTGLLGGWGSWVCRLCGSNSFYDSMSPTRRESEQGRVRRGFPLLCLYFYSLLGTTDYATSPTSPGLVPGTLPRRDLRKPSKPSKVDGSKGAGGGAAEGEEAFEGFEGEDEGFEAPFEAFEGFEAFEAENEGTFEAFEAPFQAFNGLEAPFKTLEAPSKPSKASKPPSELSK
ncbi:unnamed protein product, partial [Symbiodinium sp. CCMP2456]